MLLRYVGSPLLFAWALLEAACAKPAVHQAIPMDSLPPSMVSQPGDRQVLAGEWEYVSVDGASVPLVLDEQGNGHYDWKDGRFETHTLIDHTWQGLWFQKENNRYGGFMVEFSPDFSEGEGRWWYNAKWRNVSFQQENRTYEPQRYSTGTVRSFSRLSR